MAKKSGSFRIDEKKKAIILYSNKEANPSEKALIEFYLKNGYSPMFEEKKKGLTVATMREELKEDKNTLEEFEKAYKLKNGFFKACKIYTSWKKANKKDEKANKKDEKANKQDEE